MSDTTTEVQPLNEEQIARAAALTHARSVLMGDGFIFGGAANNRVPDELIQIAEYIVGPKPEGPQFYMQVDGKWEPISSAEAARAMPWLPVGEPPAEGVWPFGPINPSESVFAGLRKKGKQ